MPDRHGHTSRSTPLHLSLTLLVLLSMVGCGGGVAAGGAEEQQSSIPEKNVTVDRAPSTARSPLECGRPFRRPSGGELSLTGRFPGVVHASERAVSGTVEVAGANEGLRGVVTPNADVFLVRDGRIATLPQPQDLVGMRLELDPGKVESLAAQATLLPCEGGSAAGESLPPGTYELYVRVVLNHDDGSSVESVGGPWQLEVR